MVRYSSTYELGASRLISCITLKYGDRRNVHLIAAGLTKMHPDERRTSYAFYNNQVNQVWGSGWRTGGVSGQHFGQVQMNYSGGLSAAGGLVFFGERLCGCRRRGRKI